MKNYCLLICTFLAIIGCCNALDVGSKDRKIYVWAQNQLAEGGAKQWYNESWMGVFDGVIFQCGMGFTTISSGMVELTVNQTEWEQCMPLLIAVRQTQGLLVSGMGWIPQILLENSTMASHAIASAIQVAKQYNLGGFSVDDETDCSPRSTAANFTLWMNFMNKFANELHKHDLMLSAAVQALFGIEDVPYAPYCQPPYASQCSQSCAFAPWDYTPDPTVVSLLLNSTVDQFLIMDTYYFTTARFLDALDWYSSVIKPEALVIAMINRADLGPQDFAARFHALNRQIPQSIAIFELPLFDSWLMWLKRWKTHCRQCPNKGVLSCFEPSIQCDF